jgi:broad specificity phosphatase PhoE
VAVDLLVLVKHARPDVDPARPAAEWTLGVEGIEGSLRLAEHLRPLGVDLVVSSVEPKAAETGRVVAEALGLTWQTGHDLHEHVRPSVGYLEEQAFEASIRRFFEEPTREVFGDESADAAFARFDRAVEALAKAHRWKRLAVVAHGTVISLLVSRRYGADAWTTWRALGTPAYVVVDRKGRAVVDVVRSV